MIESISIEKAVQRGHFVIRPRGVSMWPMIRNGKDSVLIEPVHGRLEKYDIPLYKDRLDRYVIHRIIKVTEDGYVICGDGLHEREYDITDRNIIGVVKGFYRKEKFISCDSKAYMAYVKFWVGIIFLRKPIIETVRLKRRIKARLKEYYLRLTKGKNHFKNK